MGTEPMLLDFFRGVLLRERRKHPAPVEVDRRRSSCKNASQALHTSIDRLTDAVDKARKK